MTPPTVIALVVCENVYTESGGKTALVGLFNNINARNFPATHSRLCVYFSVTDIKPKTEFKLDIVHSETDEPVVVMGGGPPSGVNPTTVCDFVFELRNVTFPEPGRYYIRLWANDRPLVQRPFEVRQVGGK